MVRIKLVNITVHITSQTIHQTQYITDSTDDGTSLKSGKHVESNRCKIVYNCVDKSSCVENPEVWKSASDTFFKNP